MSLLANYTETRYVPHPWQIQSIPFLPEILKYGIGSLVDFGCGEGFHAEWFHEAGIEVVGVDQWLSGAARKRAAGRYELIVGNWNDLPGGYDAGFSHHVLEHARDPIGWLNEWGALIRPGGKLFIVVPAYSSDSAAGHINIGWNIGQLLYNLALAGFDCTKGRFIQQGGIIWGIVDRPECLNIIDSQIPGGWELAVERMPAALVYTGAHFCGEMKELQWLA